MTKAITIAALLFAGWIADQQLNNGFFTGGLLGMFSQIRHSFGW